MSYRIIMDSCGEIPEQYKNDERFVSIPLELEVWGVRIVSVTSAHFKNKRRTFQIEVKNERKINGCS